MQFVPPPITPDQEDPTDQQLYESVNFQESIKSGNDEGINEAQPAVSDSIGSTGTEAKARLSATVASESEAYRTDTASNSNETSIVAEKDVAHPSTIVHDNSK